jgi:hypothetical protein
MNFNKKGLVCFDWCDKLSFWIQIQEAQREHIRKQEAALRRCGAKKDNGRLREIEREIDKEVEELIKSLDESEMVLEEDRYTDEEIEAMADEILAELEEEENNE